MTHEHQSSPNAAGRYDDGIPAFLRRTPIAPAATGAKAAPVAKTMGTGLSLFERLAPQGGTTVSIGSIIVGTRHRRDLGDIDSLARNIAEIGLLQPIVIRPDGQLIAGERRLTAMRQLGWTDVPVTVVRLDDIVKGELAENTERKNFTPSEIEAIRRSYESMVREPARERMAEGGRVGKLSTPSAAGKTRDKIGAFAGVSGRNVEKIAAIVAAAEAEPERFAALVEEMDESGKVDRAYKRLKVARQREAYAARQEKGCTVHDLIALAASGYRASVIYADPPWRFEPWDDDTGNDRAPTYQVENLDEIKALPVAPLAARDCALIMWAVPDMLEPALDVIKAWGFTLRSTAFVWVKPPPFGKGYGTRKRCEISYLATIGSPKRLDEGVDEILEAPRSEHSAKPDEARARIERLYAGPYLELYGRKPVSGWTVWGDEIPAAGFGQAEAGSEAPAAATTGKEKP